MSRQPRPRVRPIAVGVGRKLHMWGGFGGTPPLPATTVETFDVPSEAWLEAKKLRYSIPDDMRGMAVTNEGERVYAFGGRTDRDTYSQEVYQIDLSTLECKKLVPTNPSYAPKATFSCGVAYFNHKLVIHGGRTEQDRTNEVHVFDLRTSESETKAKELGENSTTTCNSLSILLT